MGFSMGHVKATLEYGLVMMQCHAQELITGSVIQDQGNQLNQAQEVQVVRSVDQVVKDVDIHQEAMSYCKSYMPC